jgi:hypothetical protein
MDWSNAALLRLPAHLSDDMDWSKEREQAKEIVAADKYILWEIDLGLSKFHFTPENSAAFFSYSLALEEFTAKVWPIFRKQTLGVILYQGDCPSSKNFPRSHWEFAYTEWLNELKEQDTQLQYDLYCTQMLGEYLHRLISFLPDVVLPFALIDVSRIHSPSKIAQFFSKERFEYLHLALKGAQCPFSGICWEYGQTTAHGIISKEFLPAKPLPAPSLGIYLPKGLCMDGQLSQELDMFISQLNATHSSFRLIAEEKLTEQWDGIDQLIIPSHQISVQGMRKLHGFAATGGSITSIQGVEIEI